MEDTISRQAALDALDKRFDSIPMEQTTEILLLRKDLRNLPSAETHEKRTETHECDLISRQAAIRWVKTECNPYGKPTLDFESGKKVIEHLKQMPSAQPERLTDDDFETIRIHLNAYKEKLCNQQRWGEAAEYQRIIDRFMAFASAQPEIVRCKECKHQVKEWRTDKRLKDNGYMVCGCDVVGDACGCWALLGQDDDYCSMAERRTDE